eukprot:TRINITY_DN7351_c0_g1_i1.p1 TRINITY_DN7351_c0_g1~~TRINITY_DN7351_c0_g1_i1.p1  ORF type:complete len:170 (-),score=37.58 TRINITY_DN7351_c0_g1_i1:26-535(-)
MFYKMTLKKSLIMHPESFGPGLQESIKKALYREVEGTVDGRYGFIIMIIKVEKIDLGEVLEGGMAKFPVIYTAIVFRPFKNEVLDAVVEDVDEIGVRCEAGPLRIFIPTLGIPSDMTYDQTVPAYTSITGRIIKAGELIRLRIQGLQFDATEITAIGTIKEDYLGVFSI